VFLLPVLFATFREDLRDVFERLNVDLALADIISRHLRVGFDEVKPVAREIVSRFAREVESGNTPQFYYLDVKNHVLYYNSVRFCSIYMTVFTYSENNRYYMDLPDCRDGLAMVVLEEKLGEIVTMLSQKLGISREEVERRLRGALNELKSDPLNAVRAGFARLLILPPRSESELEQELFKYTAGFRARDKEFAKAWDAVVEADHGLAVSDYDVLMAWLAGKSVGYKLPSGYEVYEFGDRAMAVAAKTYYGVNIGWYREEGGDWYVEAYVSDLDPKTYSMLKDVVLRDFKLGRPPQAIALGLRTANLLAHAVGYEPLVKATYEMARDGRSYARIEVESKGAMLTIHVIYNPDEFDLNDKFLFLVERGGDAYILNAFMLDRLLGVYGLHSINRDLYNQLLEQDKVEEGLAEAVYKALDNPRVSAELPDHVRIQLLNYLAIRAVKSLV